MDTNKNKRKPSFTVKVAEHWHKLPRKIVDRDNQNPDGHSLGKPALGGSAEEGFTLGILRRSLPA